MQIEDPGYTYQLMVTGLPSAIHSGAPLRFYKPGTDTITAAPGTNVSEALRACHDRVEYFYRYDMPESALCRLRAAAENIANAIYLLENLAAEQQGRLPITKEDAICGEPCTRCGHVGCPGCSPQATQVTQYATAADELAAAGSR